VKRGGRRSNATVAAAVAVDGLEHRADLQPGDRAALRGSKLRLGDVHRGRDSDADAGSTGSGAAVVPVSAADVALARQLADAVAIATDLSDWPGYALAVASIARALRDARAV